MSSYSKYLKTKIIIFDQDGTLYSRNSELFKLQSNLTKKWIQKRLKFNKSELIERYAELQNKYPNPLEGFKSLGLSIKDYHESIFNRICPKKYLKRDDNLIKMFLSLPTQNFVVTFASLKYSLELQSVIGVDTYIKNTYIFFDQMTTLSKSFYYRLIKKKSGLSGNQICVIGDSYYNDILPAQNCGFNTILIDYDLDINISGADNQKCIVKNIYEIPKIIL